MPGSTQPVPINYGYNWITGIKLQSITLQNTGQTSLDWTRVGMYLLGEGEMDGLIEMWDTALGRLMWQPTTGLDPAVQENISQFHFHPGCDSVVGSGAAPVSTGNDQGVDSYWQYLPSGLQPLHYNRWAYYTFFLKWPVNNLPNNPGLDTAGGQENAAYWADVNPIGLWRGRRCRLFDATGAQNGYAFTRNPVSHFVDLLCLRKLFPEYLIDSLNGAQELPAAVARRFDWSQLADTAAYFDEVLPSTGRNRFSGDYSFAQATTLQACLSQIAQNCRSFVRERNGVFSLMADNQRASVFTFSRKNADAFTPSDADVHVAPNVMVGKFRDLLCPAAATIASIVCPDHQLPHITTEAAHCFAAGDYVVIGNTGTVYDGYAQVNSVDAADGEGNSYGLTLKNLGSNVPAAVGSGGLIGLRYSRFKDRYPEFKHKAHQLARGAVGVGIPRQRNRVIDTPDFANCTWDQVARVATWMQGSRLGPDVQPYVAPQIASLKVPFFASDAAGSGAIAAQVEPGDIVTIDDTLSYQYAGDYEVVSDDTRLSSSTAQQGSQRTADAGGITFSLRPYDPANYVDEVTDFGPGWEDVPVLPGNTQIGTEIPLADGFMIFVTGSGPSGSYFQLPYGYSAANMLAWASPQGFIEGNSPLQVIQDCDAYSNGLLQLNMYGEGGYWTGPVNWCAVAWRTRNSATVTLLPNGDNTGTLTCVELTLLGGEKIMFGKGRFPSGAQVPLLPGYTDARVFGLAFPKFSNTSGSNDAHGFRAFISPAGIIRHDYQDGSGNNWTGDAQAMVVAYQNNMGTWKQDANGWAHTTLPGGKVFALAGFAVWLPSEPAGGPQIYAPSALTTLAQQNTIPSMVGMPTISMQIMPGVVGYDLSDHHAHGVKQCYVQEAITPGTVPPVTTFIPVIAFEDGEGNQWGGALSAFMLLYDTPSGAIGTNPAPSGGTAWASGSTSGSGSGSGSSGGSGGTVDTTQNPVLGGPVQPELPVQS